MSLFNFLKKDDGNFYQWFEDAANNSFQAAVALRNLCYDYRNVKEAAARLHEFEHRGDEIGHRIYEQLNKTFITPLDREAAWGSLAEMTNGVHDRVPLRGVRFVSLWQEHHGA